MYDVILKKLENRPKPIDVIVTGVGFMGFGFLSAIQKTKGIRVLLVISRRGEEAKETLRKGGLKVSIVSNIAQIKENSGRGIISISEDVTFIDTLMADVVLEMTGTVDYGTEIGIRAIKSRKHFITMNPELQASVGSELKILADENDVLISDVMGDQPGSLARLISQARLMGFRILMAGNMKRYMDVQATQEKMLPWAKDKGLAVRQTTSFTDGTKQSIEMNLVANYFGMKVLQEGMVGSKVNSVQEVLTKFNWKKIPKEGVVDFVLGRDLFPGIFLVVEHEDPNQQKYLRYLGLGDGPQYVLFEPYHLCHLEVVQTIAKLVLFGQETINNSPVPATQTIAIAKFTLNAGTKLDGIGGDTIYGVIESADKAKNYLPIGLANRAILKKQIKAGEAIKLSDVIVPVNAATKLAGIAPSPDKKLIPFLESKIPTPFS